MPAVTRCYLRRTVGGGVDETNRTAAQVVFYFETDGDLGHLGVLNSALTFTPPAGSRNIPNFGDSYDFESELGTGEKDPTSFARSFDVRFSSESKHRGEITVTYRPLSAGENVTDVIAYQTTQPTISWDVGGNPLQGAATLTPPSGTRPPWNRGATWYVDQEPYTRIADKDKDGDPIVNAAGRSFDRPPTIEESRLVLVAEFAVEKLRDVVDLIRLYGGAVNSTAWDLFAGAGFTDPPARTALVRYMRSGKPIVEGGYAYYPVQMGFAIREDGTTWDLEILNEGYGYLQGGNYVKAVDSGGAAVSEPVLLAADGTKLAEGETGNFIAFQARKEANFNSTVLKKFLKPAS